MPFQGQIIRNQPSYRPRPVDLTRFHAFTADGFVAYVPRNLLESMVAEAKQTAPNETYGFVFGRPFRDQQGLYTLVSAVPVAKRASRQPSFVQTSLADETAAAALLDHEHMTAEKLGWWHSHPMGIANYSMTDQENQRHACPRDYQLGLLVCLNGNRSSVHAFWRLYDAKRMKFAQKTFSGGAVSPDQFFRNGTMLMRSFTRPFRPEEESVADRDAVAWSYDAGYDPREMAALFLRMHERERAGKGMAPAFFRSHPYHIDRYQAVLDQFSQLQITQPNPKLYVGKQNLNLRTPRSVREFDE